MSGEKHVYFIQKKPDGIIKIGCTKNPLKRLAELKNATGEDLKLLFVIFNSDFEKEKHLQKKFVKFRTYGEWFKPDISITKYIEKLRLKNPCYADELKEKFDLIRLKQRSSEGTKPEIKDNVVKVAFGKVKITKAEVKDKVVGIAFAKSDYETLKMIAKEHKMTISSYLREYIRKTLLKKKAG